MEHRYLLGYYDDEEPLLKAVTKLRSEGYQMHEVFTPFPVHGLDHAMGLQDTRLHTAGFVYGSIGALFAVGMMTWISAGDWQVIVGGKPFFSLPSFVPITFELTILFASVGMVITFYLRNGFSIFKEKEIVDPRITDDRFVVAFCRKQYDTTEDVSAITKLFKETGALEVKEKALQNELEPNLFKSGDDLSALAHGHH